MVQGRNLVRQGEQAFSLLERHKAGHVLNDPLETVASVFEMAEARFVAAYKMLDEFVPA